MNPRRIPQLWNDFFFKPTDSINIGIFRVLFGSILLINGIMIWPDLLVWFGDHGVLTPSTARLLSDGKRLNLLTLLPSGDHWVIRFYFFHMFTALCLTLGLFTRISTVAVFATLVSFHHRNGLILNSGDTLVRIISFLMIFSHAGAALSLDRLWKRFKNGQAIESLKVSPWAQRMIQIQISIVYFFTFVWKMHGPTWRSGIAVYYTSRLEEFQRFPVPWIFENLILIKILTWGTLALEFAMGTLIWVPRFRPYLLISALFLHLSLEYSMNIPMFQWIILSSFILFIEPEQVQVWIRKLSVTAEKFFRKPMSVKPDLINE